MAAQSKDGYLGKVQSLEDRARSLHDGIAFSDVNSELAEIETQIRYLPTAIQEVRGRGYVFKSYLEHRADALGQQLVELWPRVTRSLDEHRYELGQQASLLGRRVSALRYSRSETELAATESAMSDLESRAEAAKGSVEEMYRPMKENAEQTANQVKEIA